MQWSRRTLLNLGAAVVTACQAKSHPNPATIAYNRLAFGPRPGDLDRFTSLEDLVEEQLHPEQLDDHDLESRLQGLETLKAPLDKLWARYYLELDESDKPVRDTIAATFLRAVYSRRQLQAVLADFWHNHFNVYGYQDEVAPLFVHYDRDVIRRHSLGRFRDLLGDVTRSPAMLFYLDNFESTNAGPNENFARELLELHTLGGGYRENDVLEVARCFTGWNLDDDGYRFQAREHDRFNKLVLGDYYPSDQGVRDGLRVLDRLASHPNTARHVCTKLCRRLVADDPPPALVERAAKLFQQQWQAPDQLRQVVRLILLSREFATTFGEKLKRPFEFTASFLRATDAEVGVPDEEFLDAYDLLGQPLFQRVTPDGYPDRRENWTHTMSMLGRFDLAHRMVAGHFPCIRIGRLPVDLERLVHPRTLPQEPRARLRALAMAPEFQLR